MMSRGPGGRVLLAVGLAFAAGCTPRATDDGEESAGHVVESAPAVAPGSGVRFVDETGGSGIDFLHVSGDGDQHFIIETMGGGAAFLDYDADGYLDLYLVNGVRRGEVSPESRSRLYRNEAAGPDDRRFADVTAEAGAGGRGWGMGCAVADYDNDGDVDLYVTYWGANRLYRNRGDGRFEEQAAAAGVADESWSTSAAFGDLDADGLLDLYVANYLEFDLENPPNEGRPCTGYKGLEGFCGPMGIPGQPDLLYRNLGDGRFEDLSAAAGIDRHWLPALGVVFADYDDDGDQDLYVANDSEPNLLWRNDGGWALRETAALAGVAYSEEGRSQAGMGVDFGDVDNDGDLDLLVTNFSDDVNTLYRNLGDGTFEDATAASGLTGSVRPLLGWSTALFDADNDGWQDLFVANGHLYPQLEIHPTGLRYPQRNLLYWNRGGRFREAGTESGSALAETRVSRGGAFGDYDNDGDVDLLVVNLNDRPTLLRNEGGNANAWLGIELEGTAGNRDGIGARVSVTAGGRTQVQEVRRGYGYQSQNDGRLLFGLGSASQVEKVHIRWPSGGSQTMKAAGVRQYIKVREGSDEPVAVYGGAEAVTGVPQEFPDTAPAETPAPATGLSQKLAGIVPAVPAPVAREAFGAGKREPGAYAARGEETARAGTDPAAAPGPSTEESTAEENFLRGVELHEAARYREAVPLLRQAVRQRPHNIEPYYSLAVTLYSGLGQSREALAVLEQAVARGAAEAEVFHLLGAIRLSLNDAEGAIGDLERALQLAPGDWKIRNRLGVAHLRRQDISAAAEAFESAVAAAPFASYPYAHLARLYDRLGRPEQARAARRQFEHWRPLQDRLDRYREGLRTLPNDPELHFLVGRTYLMQQRGGEAQAAFERALRLELGYAMAHYGLGGAHHQQGRLAFAIAEYERACALDSTLFTALNDLGRAYHQTGDQERAVEVLERAVRLRPDLARAHLNLGRSYAELGRKADAVRALETAAALDPGMRQTGIALRRLRELEE